MRIPTVVLREIAAHAAADYPAECCGLLVGSGATIHRAEPVRNLRALERCDRFELDPVAYVRIWEAARARGERIIGCYHSHPDGVAQPSSLDRQLARKFGGPFGYLVVAVHPGEDCSIFGGLIEPGGEIVAVPLDVQDEGSGIEEQ